MHIACFAAAFLLYGSSVTAFYPYSFTNPTSGEDGKEKRFYPFHPGTLEDNAEAPSLIIEKKPIPKSRRDNKYSILKSDPPTAPNSIAIDQDGSDFSYVISMAFGTSNTPLYMLLDTGASNTFVMSSDCHTSACTNHSTFGASDSKTFRTDPTATWDVTYGTGSVSGIGGSDSVQLAGFNLDTFSFGVATNASDEFNSYVMDGILGLGRSSTTQINTPSLISALKSKNLIKDNILSVHLRRHAERPADGVLTFGSVNTALLNGDLSYTTTVPNSNLWEIPAGGFGAAGKQAPLPPNTTALIDTGTSWILLPPTDAAALHALIPGAKQTSSSSQSGEWLLPCDASVPVQFTFSGMTYDVSPKDYIGTTDQASGMCESNIVGHQAFGEHTWLLGDVFLKNVLTVFDYGDANGGEGRVGFGKVKEPASSTPAATTTGSGAGAGATATAKGSQAPGAKGSTTTAAAGAGPTATESGRASGMGLGSGEASTRAPGIGLVVAMGALVGIGAVLV